MKLKGSCQCEKVSFTVESSTYYPFMFCYCSICRKTSGGLCGCNIMGEKKTLKVKGKQYLRAYHAIIRNPGKKAKVSSAERWFCKNCGTHLYLTDDEYDYGVWPSAAVIDSKLPAVKNRVHLMLRYKPNWVPIVGKGQHFPIYPKLSIAEWHKRHHPELTKQKKKP